jgi:uncharacterized OB-fold protein
MSDFSKFTAFARAESAARDRAIAEGRLAGCGCPACASPFVPRRERTAEIPAATSDAAAATNGPLRMFCDEVKAAAEIHNSNGVK